MNSQVIPKKDLHKRLNQDRNISPVKDKPQKLVDKLIHLGSSISATESNVDICGGKAWIAIDKLMTIWKSDLIKKQNKTREFFQTVDVSVLFNVFISSCTCIGCNTRSIFKQSLTGFNAEFSFSYTGCHTKIKEPSLPYYISIAGGRIIRFITFPRILMLCKMQIVC